MHTYKSVKPRLLKLRKVCASRTHIYILISLLPQLLLPLYGEDLVNGPYT